MKGEVGDLVAGERRAEPQLEDPGEPIRALGGLGERLLDHGRDDAWLVDELLMLLDTYEEVAQVGDEPADAYRSLVEGHLERLLDDLDELGDDRGHRVRVREVSGREPGVHQVQRQRHGFALGELSVESVVDGREQRERLAVLAPVQVLHFGEEGVLEHQTVLEASYSDCLLYT